MAQEPMTDAEREQKVAEICEFIEHLPGVVIPEYMRFLLAERDRLQQDNGRLRLNLFEKLDRVKLLEAELAGVRLRVADLKERLDNKREIS